MGSSKDAKIPVRRVGGDRGRGYCWAACIDISESEAPKTHLDSAMQMIAAYRRRFAVRPQLPHGHLLTRRRLIMSVSVVCKFHTIFILRPRIDVDAPIAN